MKFKLMLLIITMIFISGCNMKSTETTSDDFLEALKPSVEVDNHILNWEVRLERGITSFVEDIEKEELIFALKGGGLCVIDRATGKINELINYDDDDFGGMQLKLAKNHIIAHNRRHIFVIKRDDYSIVNKTQYTYKNMNKNGILYDVEVSGDALIVAIKGYKVMRLDIETLESIWEFEEKAEHMSQDIEIYKDQVMLRGAQEEFYRLNIDDGNVVMNASSSMIYPYYFIESKLYSSGRGKIHKYNMEHDMYEWVISNDSRIIKVSNSGRLFANDIENDIENDLLIEIDVESGKVIYTIMGYVGVLDTIETLNENLILSRNSNGLTKLYDLNLDAEIWEYDGLCFDFSEKSLIVDERDFVIPEENGVIRSFSLDKILE